MTDDMYARDPISGDVKHLIEFRWRTGRKLGRTIYAQIGAEPDDGDVLIGMVDNIELADAIVTDHNVLLAPPIDKV